MDSLHRLSKRGYPNGRYQEVPPKKPQNQKMLQSFFTQGLPRVPDLQTKIEIKKKKFGFGDGGEYSLHEMSSQLWTGTITLLREHLWCGNDGGLSGEFSCSPGCSQISPIIGNIKSVAVPVHPLLLLWTAWVLSGPLCSREVSASLWAPGQTLPPGPGSLDTGHTTDQRLRGTLGGRALGSSIMGL